MVVVVAVVVAVDVALDVAVAMATHFKEQPSIISVLDVSGQGKNLRLRVSSYFHF